MHVLHQYNETLQFGGKKYTHNVHIAQRAHIVSNSLISVILYQLLSKFEGIN